MAEERPEFPIEAGLASLDYMARGVGYEITGTDVLDGYEAVMKAAAVAGIPEAAVEANIRATIAAAKSVVRLWKWFWQGT